MSKPIRKGKVFVMLYAFYTHVALTTMYCICTSFMKYTHPETEIQWLQPIKKLMLGVNLYSRI